MMKRFKKMFATVLCIIMMLTVVPLSNFVGIELSRWFDFSIASSAADYSGNCGNTLVWNYNPSTNTLTISVIKNWNAGPMYNYSNFFNRPWDSYEDSIKTVVIGKGVTTIGENAFYDCDNLKSVTIADSVTTIGDSAFEGCQNLTSITIPDGVTKIASNAFSWCTNLTNVTISDSVKSIESNAFSKSSNITNIYYKGNLLGWCNILFSNAYSNPMHCGGNLYIDDVHIKGDLIIPSKATEINRYAFYNCDSITNVTIPDSVTTIGASAFYDCDSITNVTIPDSVTTINPFTFYDCDNIKSVTIPDSVTAIEPYTFYNCRKLRSVTIPDSVITINPYAFYNCDSIINITIPDSVTTIKERAFFGCGLTSVILPNSVTAIGECAFADCYSLKTIILPDSLKSIGDDAFNGTDYYYDNNNWENFVLYIGKHLIDTESSYLGTVSGLYKIKEGTIIIADGAFYERTKLTNVSIPDSVITIGNSAFQNCTKLTNVNIPDSVTTIGNSAFQSCTSLIKVNIPDSVTTIGDFAFNYCKALADITIPDSVTAIGMYAFSSTNIKSITLPDGITKISRGTFSSCENLRSITIPDTVKTIDSDAFYLCDFLFDVYYWGREEDWNKITIDYSDNHALTTAKIHFNNCEHIFGDWIVVTEVTCTREGVEKQVCSECNKVNKRKIPTTEHSYDVVVTPPTCTKQGCTTHTCVCGDNYVTDYVDAKGHTTGEWVVTKPATSTQSGTKTQSCTVCGSVLNTQTIPAYGKVNSVSVSNVSLDYKSSTTLNPQISIDAGVKYTVSYSSSNPSVASVDANGKITTKDTGSATITVTVTDEYGNTVSDTCNVEVKYNWWQWILVIVLFGWIWY